MAAPYSVTIDSSRFSPEEPAVVTDPVTGADITAGTGFRAQSFRARDIGPAMDPLVMVDHYQMTKPTFGVHPHAGLSAVSLLLDDSEGRFHNRDSLDNDFDLLPGDLYWLWAGSGAVHDESPRAHSRIHGLQVFINVPQSRRFEAPTSLLVRSINMPVIRGRDYRVKVALGESNGVRGAASPSVPMTVLDGTVEPRGEFAHTSAGNRGVWIHAIEGSMSILVGRTIRHLAPGQAVAVSTKKREDICVRNSTTGTVHFALFDGDRIDEDYVQEGPFVMGSEKQIADIKSAYEAGRLGRITNPIQRRQA